jgi:hypothetical protein
LTPFGCCHLSGFDYYDYRLLLLLLLLRRGYGCSRHRWCHRGSFWDSRYRPFCTGICLYSCRRDNNESCPPNPYRSSLSLYFEFIGSKFSYLSGYCLKSSVSGFKFSAWIFIVVYILVYTKRGVRADRYNGLVGKDKLSIRGCF